MKVPSLSIKSSFIAVYNDGKIKSVSESSITGCFQMQQHLERNFGIKISRSTVFDCKKLLTPVKYPHGRTREYYLAYLNWVLNYPKEERAEFFDNELDKQKFIRNNPIIDIKISLSK